MVVNYIRVQNQNLPIEVFNALCDKLSLLRHCCMDYRMVSDFDPVKEKPYWHSCSYPASCTVEIQATLSSVCEDVHQFCKKAGVRHDSVVVELASANIDK